MNSRLFDYFISSSEQRNRHGDPERLRSFEVDYQLHLRGLLDRQIGGLLALEDAAGVEAGKTVRVLDTTSVTDKAAGCGEIACLKDCGHRMANRQCGKLLAA